MNSIFDKAELMMIDEIMKRGSITGKRFTDRKKYIKEVVRRLYLSL